MAAVGGRGCTGLEEVLYSRGSILFGEYRLSSGGTTRVYVDLRRLIGDRVAFAAAASLLAWELRGVIGGYDYVVGVATGGIPWASFISMVYGRPMAYVRLERKAHGTSSRVEGGVSGGSCLVVDDVATTGSSLLAAVEALRGAGCRVGHAAVLVDRGQGAREALAGAGVELVSAATLEGILSCLAGKGLVARELLESL